MSVLEGDGVIVPPKTEPKSVRFRWPPDLVEEIEAIAARTGRSMNEAGELMMRWAVERTKAELETGPDGGLSSKRKKQ